MAREDLSPLKSMVLCAVLGVVETGDSARCLLPTLHVAAEAIIRELSSLVEPQ